MPAKRMNFLKRLLTVLAAGIIAVALAACGKNSNSPPPTNAEGSPAQTKAEPTPQSAFERDLQDVRNSQFAHVWVFSRKDGKVLDKADAAYLRTNAPQVVDWVSTDGKKVVAGTNFDLEQGNLGLLRKRFVVEDYTGK